MLGFGHKYKQLKNILKAEDCVILFHHIHKTAGTTAETAIAEYFGASALRCHNQADRQNVHEIFENNSIPGRKFIYGHGTTGIEKELEQYGVEPGKNLFRFTFIRNPRTRLESLYNFMKLRDENFDMDFKEYLSSTYADNAYCKFLDTDAPSQFLKNHIEFVGTQERFNETVSVLFDLLDMKQEKVRSKTVNPNAKELMRPDLFNQFFKSQVLDYRLFEMVNMAIDKYMEDFQGELVGDYIDQTSFAKKARINENIDKNNNTHSLHATGLHLVDQGRVEDAKAFFVKAAVINFGAYSKVKSALAKKQPELLSEIKKELSDHYKGSDDARVEKELFS